MTTKRKHYIYDDEEIRQAQQKSNENLCYTYKFTKEKPVPYRSFWVSISIIVSILTILTFIVIDYFITK